MDWKWALLVFPLFTIIRITELCLSQVREKPLHRLPKLKTVIYLVWKHSGHKDPRKLPLPLGDLRISITTMMQCVISRQGMEQNRREQKSELAQAVHRRAKCTLSPGLTACVTRRIGSVLWYPRRSKDKAIFQPPASFRGACRTICTLVRQVALCISLKPYG